MQIKHVTEIVPVVDMVSIAQGKILYAEKTNRL